ncbi:MAG: hypothetical protein ABRQ37_05125 [Candidatus Eremiobacterota bacterium]
MYIDEKRKKSLVKNIVKIIKEWNSVYHPTDGDYKRLAEQILNHLEEEHVISFTQKSTEKNIER